jgi:hypothetical protein
VLSGAEIVWRPNNISGARVIVSPDDLVPDAVVTMDLVHHEVHEGDYFGAYLYSENASVVSGVVYHVLTPNAKGIHWDAYIESDIAGVLELWENATVSTSGAIVFARNNRRDSATSSTVLVFSQPGYTSGAGTLLDKRYVGASNPKTEIGGSIRNTVERILKSGEDYLIKFVPISSPNHVYIKSEWYETG